MKRLVITRGLLIMLRATELAASYLPFARAWRPLILLPGVLMVSLVAVFFMEIKKEPVIVRAFAAAAVFWLFILLALGSVDPLTRTTHEVPGTRASRVPPPWRYGTCEARPGGHGPVSFSGIEPALEDPSSPK